ncbi:MULTISPECIES: 2-oxo-tetronate isomerase [Mycolicibacterium]|uniref:Hydroxypyruvate isomerase n=1 Tax=Mycolicibacterium senegalense TaxID=1796 RepID=A0A378SXD2_9MYCO|nr:MULTISPECIES: 2-oxo-tetronate isomerase [Mycolicibacterium]MCV7334707.1 hydroxypyruvate isomerase family protein [Mycolicibacterium senegalense]MDR7291819.1 hydroxypyruvate isomerase [Mycolicibacterium senegalense]QZA23261.1 hydroxypyruvate isomerase family protein [Mycolicibacterium senegalense]CDP89789.1 hydroxypyruvate isomerase [Mycolicibacterium farcinogenes]STZ53179.1 hydroxypyruvate isomerase [Mycolicibacterium senegalense]
MPRFAANLSMMYVEHAFPDRFAAAAADGFTAVEYLFPYAYPAEHLRGLLDANGLRQVLFNAPPGDFESGERGVASLPGREAEFRDGFRHALTYAETLKCPRVHVMAGLAPAAAERVERLEVYRGNLTWAAAQAADRGVEVMIEPINQRDMPGYLLSFQDEAHRIVDEVGAPNLKVQLDLYHCQITEGDVTVRLRSDIPTGRVGHLQIAGVPDRHEPDSGELAIDYLLAVIDETGFDGWVGCEYRPAAGTSEGLGWMRGARG